MRRTGLLAVLAVGASLAALSAGVAAARRAIERGGAWLREVLTT